MRRKVIFSAVILTCAMALPTFAQEAPAPREMLRWFPDGVYSQFGAYNIAAARKAEAFEAASVLVSPSVMNLGEQPRLPEDFIKKADYYCYAQALDKELLHESELINDMENRLDGEMEKAAQRGGKISEEQQKKWKELQERAKNTRFGGRLWVFSIPELDLLVDASLKSGEFARSGKKLKGRPLYSISADRGKGGGEAYAWASAAGELLVADTPATILAMVRAGEGGGLRMIENQEYSDFFGYISEFGQMWRVEAKRAMKEFTLEMKIATNASEHEISEVEKDLEHSVLFEIQNIFLSDVAVARSSKVYPSTESAQEAYEQTSGALRQASAEINKQRKEVLSSDEAEKLNAQQRNIARRAMGFAGALLESQETTIDGVVVTTTITFGKQQLNTLNTLMTFAKAMEERERENKESKEK